MSDTNFHAARRAMAAGQAAWDNAEPPDCEDDLLEAMDAAIDELQSLRRLMFTGHKSRDEVASEVREIAQYLGDVHP